MKYDRMNRRMFLQGSGNLLIAIPFLPSLLGRYALAAESASLMKYVQILNLQGPIRESALPGNGSLLAQQDIGDYAKMQSLADIINNSGSISKIHGQEWNEVSQYVNLISNYHAYSNNTLHNTTIPTTGDGVFKDNPRAANFPYSIDYVLEKELNASGNTVRTDFDRAGVYQNFSFDGKKDSNSVPLTMSSISNFDALKLGVVVPSCDPVVTPPTPNPTPQTNLNELILNAVIDDYKNIKNNRWLSKVDDQRFSDHIDNLNDVLKKHTTDTSNSQSGSTPGTDILNPNLCDNPPSSPGENLRTKHEAALDLIAIGLATGQYRVASHTIKAGADNLSDPATLHSYHHNTRSAIDEVIQWRSKLVARFIATLAKTNDVNGEPLINSTMVYWAQEYADCNNGDKDGAAHQVHSYTGIIAGNAQGKINTGNHIDAGGAPMGRILITLFKAMRLSSSQYERGGVRGFGGYETSTSNQARQYGGLTQERAEFFANSAQRRKGLPIINNWNTD